MSRSASTFRERDVRAAIRALEKQGMEVSGIELAPGGVVRILTLPPLRAVEKVEGRGWEDAYK